MALLLPLLLLSATPLAPSEIDRDAFRTEEVSDAVAPLAKRLCTALQTHDAAALPTLLSSSFRGTPPGGAAPMESAPFVEGLLAYYGRAALLRRCSFKPFAFHTNHPHTRAEGTFSLVVGGLDHESQRFGDRGDAEVALVREGGAWRFDALTFQPRRWRSGEIPEFTEVTTELGIPRTFADRHEVSLHLMTGLLDNGGLAVGDYDGDGLADIFVVRDGPALLFHQQGDGGFEEVAKRAGVADPGNGRSALWVDLDNDGDLDLVVVNRADHHTQRGIHLYRNDGAGHFTDVTAGSGMERAGQFTSVVAADVDGDGLLDLYVCQYGFPEVNHNLLDAHNGLPNLLFHNRGGLRFEEVGKRAGVAGSEWSLAAAFTDLDGDRKPELWVANDYGSPRLYRNVSVPGTARFEEVNEADAGIADPGNGMGVDVGDYDGDGRLDVYLSKMYSKAGNRVLSLDPKGSPRWIDAARRAARGNSLFRNLGGLRFTEVGEEAGVRRAGWAWSTEFADLDLDGSPDLFVTNGYHTGPREDDL